MRAGPVSWVAAGVGVLLAHRFGLLNPLFDAFRRLKEEGARASETAQTQISISNIYGTAARVEAGGTPWFSELADAMRKSTEWAYNAGEARRIEGEMREAEKIFGPGSAYAKPVPTAWEAITLPPLPLRPPAPTPTPQPAPLPISGPTFNPAPSDVQVVTQTMPGLFEVLFKTGERRMVTSQDVATIPEAAALVAAIPPITSVGGLGSSFRVGSAYWAPGIGPGLWGVGSTSGAATYFKTQAEAQLFAQSGFGTPFNLAGW